MKTLSYIVVILILTVASAKRPKLRVLHGVADVHNEFPYVVSLLRVPIDAVINGDQILYEYVIRLGTGTLIAPTWVLTASHCLSVDLRLVRYGNMSVPHNETKSISKVLKQIYHPSYKMQASFGLVQNDIALVMIEPICMTPGTVSSVDYKTLVGLRVRYAGFGLTFDLTKGLQNKSHIFAQDQFRPLQIGEGVVVKCSHDLKRWSPAVCVSPPCSNRAADSSNGDSGGPLFYNGRVVAVTSGASPLYSPEFILTPVSPYFSWMRAVMFDQGNAAKKKYCL